MFTKARKIVLSKLLYFFSENKNTSRGNAGKMKVHTSGAIAGKWLFFACFQKNRPLKKSFINRERGKEISEYRADK